MLLVLSGLGHLELLLFLVGELCGVRGWRIYVGLLELRGRGRVVDWDASFHRVSFEVSMRLRRRMFGFGEGGLRGEW